MGFMVRMTIRMVQENADASVHHRESLRSFKCKSINKGIFALLSWALSMAQYVQSWGTRQKHTMILSRWAVGKHYLIHDKKLDSITYSMRSYSKKTANNRLTEPFNATSTEVIGGEQRPYPKTKRGHAGRM